MFSHWKKGNVTQHKRHTLSSSIRTMERCRSSLCTYSCLHMTICQVDMYLYVRIDVGQNLTGKRKHHPPQGDDTSTLKAVDCMVGSGKQCEAPPGMSTPRGRSHPSYDVYGSKPRVSLTSRLLGRHTQRNPPCIYSSYAERLQPFEFLTKMPSIYPNLRASVQ